MIWVLELSHFSLSASRSSYELSGLGKLGSLHAIACQQISVRFIVNLALSAVVEVQVRKNPCVCIQPIRLIASSAQLSSLQIGLPCSLHEKHDTAATFTTKRHPSMSKSRPTDGQREKENSKKVKAGADVRLVL